MGYGDTAAAAAYHILHGNTEWASTDYDDTQRDAARERSTVFLDGSYFDRWPGIPTGGVSQLEGWPRDDAADVFGNEITDGTTPTQVDNACYEGALLELITPGSLTQAINNNQIIKSNKIDTLRKEFFDPRDQSGSTQGSGVVLPRVESILAPILLPSGSKNITGLTV